MCCCLLSQGLVKYDYSLDQVSLLATHVSTSSPVDAGSEITYANDLAIASDGKVYFTSCTDIVPGVNKAGFYDTFRAWMLGLAQVRFWLGVALQGLRPLGPYCQSVKAVVFK